MKLENAVRMFAGFIVLLSVALTYFVSPWWMFLTIFVGFNLIQSSITRFCPAEIIINKAFYEKREQAKEISSQRA